MPTRLLERQISLLEHLTSAGAIFGDGALPGRHLQGLDPALLRLEACFSHEKRMEKINSTFPRTFEAMRGDDRIDIVRSFVEACPSVDISRIENARQFEWLETENERLLADVNIEHNMICDGAAMQRI